MAMASSQVVKTESSPEKPSALRALKHWSRGDPRMLDLEILLCPSPSLLSFLTFHLA
jgi:hypothetical protein